MSNVHLVWILPVAAVVSALIAEAVERIGRRKDD